MKIGLIGLPNSGKTTIFNALTASEAEITSYANNGTKPNLAVVYVEDERVTRLAAMYRPKRTVYATIELADFAGFAGSVDKNGSIPDSMMRLIKTTDALAAVIRNFTDDWLGPPTPLADVARLNDELLIADLIATETRLERIEWANKRGKKTKELAFEEKVLRKILTQLNENRPIRELELSASEQKVISGFQFLTLKSLMLILNSDEANFGADEALLTEIQSLYETVEFAGKFEMELAQLDDAEEAELFMQELGITASAQRRLTQLAYKTLGHISFFTVGADEVRAWNIRAGDPAVDAAGVIHSDLKRGFIRAECFSYQALMSFGSEKGVRENGQFRLEGKDYLVQDGDILNIRFHV
ncbi:MAG: redox-regulated ATPase YchF [Chloroflexi bacterium]|nr:redox-regulated ATPase YchF [Chloroflexota bacterium]